jgi:hypothetical protein
VLPKQPCVYCEQAIQIGKVRIAVAVEWAFLYPEPARLKRKSDVVDRNFDKARLSNARQIVNHSRDLAKAVRDNLMKFEDALDEVRRIEFGVEAVTSLTACAPNAPCQRPKRNR